MTDQQNEFLSRSDGTAMPFFCAVVPPVRERTGGNKLKSKRVYVRTENRVDQLKKTDQKKRNTYVYRYHETETVNGTIRDITEEIEIIPGQDGVTANDIKNLYSIEDSEVYFNLKARRSERDEQEKNEIRKFESEFIRGFKAAHGYAPNRYDIKDAVDNAFPRNWTESIEDLTSSNDEDDDIGDKSSALADAWYATHPQKSRSEERLAELRETWSDSWKEIYDRVLIGGESIVTIARERGVNESAVRKTVRKIRKAIYNDPELKKLNAPRGTK